MLGDTLTKMWCVENSDGFIIWSSFDYKVALKQQKIIEDRNNKNQK